MKRQLAIVLGMTFLVGCGGAGNSPVAPTPTVVPVTLTPSAQEFYVGQTYVFSAGSAPGTWSSDAPSVATAAGGQVTITGVGDATIIFDGPAAHGTLRITTYPNFQGNWEGSYQVTACRDDGQMAQLRWCDGSNANGTFAVGRVLPFSSTLTQNRTSVSGSVALGQLLSDAFTAPISGPTLGIQTQVTTSVSNIAQSWTFNMTDSSQLKGTGWFAWRPTTGLSGSVTVEVRLVSVTRRDGSRGHPVRGITTGDPIRALMTPQ